ncbi:MAG TPA: TonB-dependent receptor [Steroidobacter sp.]|uniref:TonB-dependent receptor domain-containing protein n=1 Tax=Steroidobacter sp. TaxID=1978227 RepID=UPI002EDA497C
MNVRQIALRSSLSASVAGMALLAGGQAFAQTASKTEQTDGLEEIVVSGSRIERAGFDQPTPTTVLGADEIQRSARLNLQQSLNDLPQMRNSVSPNQSIGNTSAGTAPIEFRGLGIDRTLTLLNGRRFIGDNNLNFVPSNLVERVEMVTGGASAAWGSGAVAGVANIMLNKDLEGVTVSAQTGRSSRSDGERHAFDGSFGTHFAGGAGHFMIGAEYVNDKGIGVSGRRDRPWYGADLVMVDQDAAGNPVFELQPNVANLAPLTYGGTILSGVLAGQVFDPDGSVRPGEASDFPNLYNTLIVGSPLERLSSYARVSYDIADNTTVWADVVYGRTDVDQLFVPELTLLAFPVSATNPFLSPAIQQQLADAGEDVFLMGRFSRDALFLRFDAVRETKEAAIGIEGNFAAGWKYDAHFSHGELDDRQRLHNAMITGNFLRAIDAVEVGGQIVCSVNADADPTNDDPACAAFNPFGEGNFSPAARAYVSGTQMSNVVRKLDSGAFRVQGDPLQLWAGPLAIAFGAEWRREEQTEDIGALDAADAFSTPVVSNTPLEGSFNVKEGFFEALAPLVDNDALELHWNGAARYSDYSLSGGIWSWKLGGTARLYKDVLFRVTRSRDIRAPNISDLFAVNTINVRPVDDNDREGRNHPGYDPNPSPVILSGGNRNLVPEIARSWTGGVTFSPSFLSGFNFSVDYFDIEIANAITVPDVADVTAACAAGDAGACSSVIRDETGTITRISIISQNIASFETSGFDFEATYRLPVVSGSLSFRALATYVDELIFNLGTNVRNTAGSVGDPVPAGLPKWRGTLSAAYQTDALTVDARIRYVGGGDFNKAQNIVNPRISARTYVDLGADFTIFDNYTLFGRVSNLFDEAPPLITTTYSPHYDVVGRYYTVGLRASF